MEESEEEEEYSDDREDNAPVVIDIPNADNPDFVGLEPENDIDKKCAICGEYFYETFEAKIDPVIKQTPCMHYFDEKCINQWIHSSAWEGDSAPCPVCTRSITIKSLKDQTAKFLEEYQNQKLQKNKSRETPELEAPELETTADSDRCPICLEGLENHVHRGEIVVETPCGHVFDEACLQSALAIDPRCPLCRKPVSQTKDVAEKLRRKYTKIEFSYTPSSGDSAYLSSCLNEPVSDPLFSWSTQIHPHGRPTFSPQQSPSYSTLDPSHELLVGPENRHSIPGALIISQPLEGFSLSPMGVVEGAYGTIGKIFGDPNPVVNKVPVVVSFAYGAIDKQGDRHVTDLQIQLSEMGLEITSGATVCGIEFRLHYRYSYKYKMYYFILVMLWAQQSFYGRQQGAVAS